LQCHLSDYFDYLDSIGPPGWDGRIRFGPNGILCSGKSAMPGAKVFLAVTALVFSMMVSVESSASSPALIQAIRPCHSGGVYIQVDSSAFCGTNTFYIDPLSSGYKEMHAGLLAAMMAKKQVLLEALTSTGCNGWGTQLQAFYIYAG
jgi:hypothetical protein